MSWTYLFIWKEVCSDLEINESDMNEQGCSACGKRNLCAVSISSTKQYFDLNTTLLKQ